MDAVAVLSMANWVMAELVRVLHGLTVDEVQALVDGLAERRVPLVWQGQSAKRVLDPDLSLKDQLLLLIHSAPTPVFTADLLSWTGYKSKAYFLRLLRQMRAQRLVELSGDETEVHTLPPGSLYVEKLIANLQNVV